MPSQQTLHSIVKTLLEPAKKLWTDQVDRETSSAASSVINAIDWANVSLGGQAKLISHAVDTRTAFAAFSLVEAVQWISLGAQAGALPPDKANALIKGHLNDLKRATVIIHNTGLLNPDAASQVATLISSAESPPEFKASDPAAFGHFPESATVFTMLCSECCAFIQSEQARLFTQRLISPGIDDWNTMASSMPDETFEEEGAAIVSPTEGYLTTLQHLDRLGALLSEIDIPADKRAALALMRVPFGRMHGWRFSLDNQYYRNRFKHATDIVAKRLIRDGNAVDVHLDLATFLNAVEQVIKRYLASTGYLISQAAYH